MNLDQKYRKKKSNFVNFIIVIVALVSLLIYIEMTDGLQNIYKILSTCKITGLLIGLIIMIFCWTIESIIINIGLKIFNKKLNFSQSVKNCVLGQFFSNITPSSTGGQPFQAYYMNKCGINYGISSSVLLAKFVCFQISLTVVCSFLILFNLDQINSQNGKLAIMMWTGFYINLLIVLVLILIGLKKQIAILISKFLITLLSKIKILKHPKEKLKKVQDEIEMFSKNFTLIFKNKTKFSLIILLTVIQILCFYTVNIAIAFALKTNLTFNQMYKIIANASFIQISSMFIPLPGSSVGAEISYHIFYRDIFPYEKLNAALLLWRIYSFYLSIFLGLFFYKNLNKKRNQPN